MKKIQLKVEWKTNEYYDVDSVTILLTDENLNAIEKSREFLKANPEVDSIRIRLDENNMSTGTDYRIGVGYIMVSSGEGLYFKGQDSYDSQNQVETDSFTLN